MCIALQNRVADELDVATVGVGAIKTDLNSVSGIGSSEANAVHELPNARIGGCPSNGDVPRLGHHARDARGVKLHATGIIAAVGLICPRYIDRTGRGTDSGDFVGISRYRQRMAQSIASSRFTDLPR